VDKKKLWWWKSMRVLHGITEDLINAGFEAEE
jgi:hypothetical protein